MIQCSHTNVTKEGSTFKRWSSIHILMWQKMIQYSGTDTLEDYSVLIYIHDRRWLSIHILMLQNMIQKRIQYSHTNTIEDNLEDDRRCSRKYSKWFSIHILRLQKMIWPRSMMKMNDDVPKLRMTYRDSLVRCTDVVAVATMVEYLPC